MTEDPHVDDQDRARGALVGLATGDALGTTVEFAPRGSFAPLTDLVGGGPFRLAAGQWTDDTAMAVCLAQSLIACGDFDPADQLRRYVRWWKHGENSPTGHCFDIGGTTAKALGEFLATGAPYRAMHPRNAGNGSLMRLAPIPIAYGDLDELVLCAGLQDQTTHASAESVAACQAYAIMIRRAITGLGKEAIVTDVGAMLPDGVPPAIAAILAGSYRAKPEAGIQSGGYVVESLEAALWCFWHTDDFRTGALAAANLGHDADTTAAIYGQLAGAYYGHAGIPAAWRQILHRHDDLVAMADQLAALSQPA